MYVPSDEKPIIKEEKKTHWLSIYIAALLSFVGSVQFALYFSALWPYMQILDPDMDESFYGYTVALYSVGQIIISPFFGWWSNKIKAVSPPLCFGLFLMLTGNIFYIIMEVVDFPKRFMLLLVRFVTGMGSGNVAILRSYASTASTSEDRTKAIAWVTCGQALGLTSGPLFQLVFTALEHPGIRFFNMFSFSLYTAPAYVACMINITGLILVKFFFQEEYAGVEEDGSTSDVEQAPAKKPFVPPYDVIAVWICYATRFTDMFVRTNLETLGSPFAMMMFNLKEELAVRYMSIAQGIVGVMTMATYAAYIFLKLERWVPLRSGTIIALAGMALFHILTFSWPFLPSIHTITNGTDKAVGCNTERFSWCEQLDQVNVWVFFLSYTIVIGLTFPLMQITLNTLFSKILGPRRQGSEQGWLQVSSAVGRMIGPIGASKLYQSNGPRPKNGAVEGGSDAFTKMFNFDDFKFGQLAELVDSLHTRTDTKDLR
ncbi:unnamed protein product [Bursaphelenchus xylophilus]|uniref:(pine wood nematode) hypothetical protein n=1 Tax=Bursaphelenchus xylophilus TaxID=6326 RepID=A0A811LS28_BURXY|nr:unnamed protein product [Bursaphelenchus xylophilus]CAG9121746.1 unnamed protein product [Bursaphelenchus xylophilus]